jgi:hypothetical protein
MSRQPRSRFGCHRGPGTCETNRQGSQPAAGRQGQQGAAARGRRALTLPSVALHARSDTYSRDEGHVTLATLLIWLPSRRRSLRNQSTGESASSGATRPTRSGSGRRALTLPSAALHARSDTYRRDEGHVTSATLSIWLKPSSRKLRDQSTGESASSGGTRPTRSGSAGKACSDAASVAPHARSDTH